MVPAVWIGSQLSEPNMVLQSVVDAEFPGSFPARNVAGDCPPFRMAPY